MIYRKHKLIIALIVASILLGCAPRANKPPVIYDIRDSMARIHVNLGSPDLLTGKTPPVDMDAVMAKAEEGCKLYEKKAKLISQACAVYGEVGITDLLKKEYCKEQHYLFSCY